jgi:hypothetical protein
MKYWAAAVREPKPAWGSVPVALRRRTEALLGAPVARAVRVYGGYAPTATFRLRLADGRRAFFKATYPLPAGSPIEWALEREERVYQRVGGLIEPWAPAYHGSIRLAGWHAIVLDDVGPATVPPWTTARARAALRAFGAFHRSTFGRPLPRRLPAGRLWCSVADGWDRLLGSPDGAARLTGLAGPRADEARAWLDAHLARLRDETLAFARTRPPYALVHLDARSDNIRVHPRAAAPLRLFDWPFACAGPPEIDVAFFAQTITCEGGPAPEVLTAWYAIDGPLRPAVLAGAVAAVAGFFAARAWQPELADLPRLRAWQRQQLCASLAWAARLLGLPEPGWVEGVAP